MTSGDRVVYVQNQQLTTANFGNYQVDPTTGVTGVKWNNRVQDSYRDEDEEGLSGFRIYVDYNTNSRLDPGEPSAVTGSDGSYSILGLTSGSQLLREVPRASGAKVLLSGAMQGGKSLRA